MTLKLSSKYIGVYRQKGTLMWSCKIKNIFIGSFPFSKDAAIAYAKERVLLDAETGRTTPEKLKRLLFLYYSKKEKTS